MSVTLIACTTSDLDALRKISADTFIETFAEQNTPEDMERYINDSFAEEEFTSQIENPHSAFFLALVDGQVAGYLKINTGDAQTEDEGADTLEVERIYVLERFKGHGLGKTMIDQAISEAEASGLTTVWLGVWEHNNAARSFYEHLEFTVTGSHVFILGDATQTDLIMKRAL